VNYGRAHPLEACGPGYKIEAGVLCFNSPGNWLNYVSIACNLDVAWALVRRRVLSKDGPVVAITRTSNARARDLSYSGFISHTYRAQRFKLCQTISEFEILLVS